MPPTPTAPAPTSPTAPVAAPTSPSTPQPALLDLSTFATNSECMVDGGQDALCLPIENSTLAVCLDRNSANTECEWWYVDYVLGEHYCCQSCVVCPQGCTNIIGFNCENQAADLLSDCGCP
mmetsp:Transcript_43287/g.80439  ORF Transcript_43287/g.80439 Transcript_43287/m.80439 type:complete len:121 (+) Transcript_43287:761-1123(+)